MADAITLFEEGYFAGGISLIFNSSTQTTYKTLYGIQNQVADTDVLLHVPDFGESAPIRATDLDRVFFFEVNVDGGSNDATIDALARLMRWVDGANQPALRYHMLDDAVELRLRVQLDNATNHTEASVKWGFVDASAAWFNEPAMVNDQAYGVVVALHLSPYSEGASITLHNDLSNGDFLVESSTSGLAQDWTSSGTAPTLTLDTTIYLINGTSQKAVTGTTGDSGILSATVTASSSSNLCAFVWIYLASGDAVTAILRDGSGTTIDSAKTTDAGLKTITDRNGNSWKRLELNGTNVAANCALRIIRATGDATAATTFYVDGAYLQVGTQTVPSGGWVSFCDLDMRADEDNSNMGRRNWLDLALIPGDAPALVRYQTDSDASSGLEWYITRFVDGRILAKDNTHWVESGSFTDPVGEDTNGSWSETTGSGTYSNGDFWRFAASGGVGSGPIRYLPSGDTARQLYSGPKALFVQCSSDDGTLAATVSASVNNIGGGGLNAIASPIKVASDTIHILPVGILNLELPPGDEVPDNTKPSTVSIDIDVSAIPDTKDINIDGLWLLPLNEDEFHIYHPVLGGTNSWFDGKNERVVESQLGIAEPEVLGSKKWRLEPGLRGNRVVFLWTRSQSTSEITVTSTNLVTVVVWPRTRQLLGTV